MILTDELKEQIKTEYITSETSIRKLASKYDVAVSTLGKVARIECWSTLKRAETSETVNRQMPEIIDSLVKVQEEAAERLLRMTDKLSAKVEQLLDLDEPLAPRDVKSVSGAMLDIKLLYGLKTPEERREQDARIRTLEKGLEENANKDTTVKVEFVNMEWETDNADTTTA